MIYPKHFSAMKTSFLVGGALFGLWTGGSLPAYAEGAAPAQPSSAPPTATPTAPAPTAPVAPTSSVSSEVSPGELQKFAKVVKQLLALDQTTEAEMIAAIEKSGLPKDRFLAIYLAKRDPAGKPDVKITADEAKQYANAETQVTAIQKSAIAKQDEAIKSEGFNGQRFNQIMNAVQADPKLQQDLRKMLQS
jgi:hypothetical protein